MNKRPMSGVEAGVQPDAFGRADCRAGISSLDFGLVDFELSIFEDALPDTFPFDFILL